jgi:ubiquinone/menaquinone biosynthesis C-methylase UbiE
LDVGCGDGELIELARRNSFSELRCINTYIEDALNNIMRRGFSQRIKCVAAKAEDIPFESRFFYFIYSIRSLHEFYNPVKALKEIRRLLNPNGEMIIIDWKKGAYTGAFETYYGKYELRKFLEQAGAHPRNVKMKEIGRFNLLYSGRSC